MRSKSNFHLNELRAILESKNVSITEKVEEVRAEIDLNFLILESESEWDIYSKSIQSNLLKFIKIVESTKEDIEDNAKEQYLSKMEL